MIHAQLLYEILLRIRKRLRFCKHMFDIVYRNLNDFLLTWAAPQCPGPVCETYIMIFCENGKFLLVIMIYLY